ncbi:MAG: TIGR01777 family oxidoreductase [Bacteroidales bacterium]|nr:TIGR01777 family oxidoreductase [Bacteroidales bacterium]
MNILIIGATGLIGRSLVTELETAGYKVIASSRNVEKAREILGNTTEIRHWDGRSSRGLTDILTDIDGIINLAGENIASGIWTKKRKKKISDSRISTGRLVTEAILQMDKKPTFLIQASGIGFYGTHVSIPADESREVGSGFIAGLVAKWEESVSMLHGAGMRVVYLRTGIVLAKNGGMLQKMLLPFRFYAGTILGSGKQMISWIALTDLVRAILHLIENEKAQGPYNLVAPQAVSMKDFTRAIGNTLKKPVWLRLPAYFLRVFMGQMASETILASQVILPTKLLQEGFSFQFENLDKALQDIFNKKSH